VKASYHSDEIPHGLNPMATPLRQKSPKKVTEDDSSPLMANAKTSAVDQRELMRKKREERRKQRDEHIAEFDSALSLETGAKSKTDSEPKALHKEREKKDAKLGRCHKFGTLLVKLVHVFDALIGLTFIIYGSMIATGFETPATGAVVTTLMYGSVMLFTSIIGVVSFYSPRHKRIGLLVSAYSAPVVVVFYIVAMIAELGFSASIIDYLTKNMDVLYLNEAKIATLKQILPLFFVVLASLTAIEVCRFLLLSRLRERLVRFDASNRSTSSSNRTPKSSKKKKKKASKKSQGAGSTRSDQTEPLIPDEEALVTREKDGDY